MIAEITGVVQSVKVLNDLVKAAIGLKNFNEFVAAISEVNARLMEAQSAALSAQEKQFTFDKRIGELEKEVMDLKNWECEAQRYKLTEIVSGVFAYKLKPEVQPPEPSHMLCANCYAKRKKSILQLCNRNEFGEFYICHDCKSEISIYKNPGDSSPGYNPLTDCR